MKHVAALTTLELLNLRDSQVTDAGLVHITGLTKLRGLELIGTPVTDAGLVHLESLTRLESLYLDRTAVGDEGLIQQLHFDRLDRLFQRASQAIGTEIHGERLRPQRTERTGVESQSAEATGVFKNEPAFPQQKDERDVLWQGRGCRLEIHSAGHAQVAEKTEIRARPGTPQSEQQVFAAPGQCQKPRARQGAFELRPRDGPQHFGAPDLHVANRSVFQQGREVAHENFNFRQFRHGQKSAVTVGRRKGKRVRQVPNLPDLPVAQQHFRLPAAPALLFDSLAP